MENKVEFYPVLRKLITYKIYIHICKDKNKYGNYGMYFGITCQKINKRWGNNGIGYKRIDKNGNLGYFYNAIQKHGWNSFEHIILHEYLSKWEAEELEKKFIAYYHTDDDKYGYNGTKGGEGNIPNEDTRRKLSESHKGEKAYWYNKTIPLEIRKKMSENHANIYGEKHYLFNKNRSEETKNKIMQKQNCSIVVCNETNIRYSSIRDASRKTGMNRTYIKKSCDGTLKIVNTYTFSYIKKSTINIDKIQVICLDTGIIYKSISNAVVNTGAKHKSIKRCCDLCTVFNTANKLHWMFLDDVIKNIILLTNPDLYVKMLL